MKMSSRLAELKDAEFITGLCEQLGYKTTVEKIQDRLSEILKNGDHCVFVIPGNENIIGWIHAFYTSRIESGSFVEIGGLIVDSAYRKKGIGRELVKKVIEWADLRKCSKLRVRCNSLRQETHRFYTNLSFLEIKEQKVFELELNN